MKDKADTAGQPAPQPGAGFVALVTALTALGSVSVSVYVPSLPAIAREFSASAGAVKLTLTAFLVAFAAVQLAYGPTSDRFGRRPPILVGLAIYIAGSLACAVAQTTAELTAARVLQALDAGAGPALGRAVLRDRLEGPRLAATLAVVSSAVALSPALGPVLGGFVQVWVGWRSGFLLLAALGAALFLACHRWLAESDTHPDPNALHVRAVVVHYRALLGDARYVALLLAGGLVAACNFAWTAGAPFVFVDLLGFRPDAYGVANLGVGASYVAGTLAVMRLGGRIAPGHMLFAGAALAMTGGAALVGTSLAAAPGAADLIAAMALVALGMGITVPVSAAGALSRHPEMAGAAAALLGAGQIAIGAGVTAILSALGGARTPLPMASLVALCAALSLGSVAAAQARAAAAATRP